MSKMHKTIADYMTPGPHATNVNDNLHAAREKMMKIGARHLPVLDDGKLVGVVSDRDIQLALGFKHGNIKTMTVSDVFADEPYVTHPDTNLRTVAMEMAERKIGSAVVMDNEEVVGIFTTTDACRALHDVLG